MTTIRNPLDLIDSVGRRLPDRQLPAFSAKLHDRRLRHSKSDCRCDRRRREAQDEINFEIG